LEYNENERTRKVLREKSLGGNEMGGGVQKKSTAKCTIGKHPRIIHRVAIVVDHWKMLTK
jgi:hypothetical protein